MKVHDICVIILHLLFYFPICLLTWMNCTPWGSWFPLINGFLSIQGSDVFLLLVTIYIQLPWIHLCREDLCLMNFLLCVIFCLPLSNKPFIWYADWFLLMSRAFAWLHNPTVHHWFTIVNCLFLSLFSSSCSSINPIKSFYFKMC